MTYKLDQTDALDALYLTARKFPNGGITGLAAAMGMSGSLLYKKLERRTESHQLLFDEYDHALGRCAAAGVPEWDLSLRALNWRHGFMAICMPEVSSLRPEELAQNVVDIFKEGGDVAAIVREISSDGHITREDHKRASIEIREAVVKLLELDERIRLKSIETPRRLGRAA